MNKCPNCNQIYPNDDIFCVNDGTTLLPIPASGQNPTIFYASSEIPTQVISSPRINPPGASIDYRWLYAIIGVMGTAIAAIAVFMFLPKNVVLPETSKNEQTFNPLHDSVQANIPRTKNTLENPQLATQTKPNNSPIPVNSEIPVYVPPRPALSPGGIWTGNWSSPSGAYFSLKVSLSDDGTGKVQGEIEWTMRRTTRPEKMSKIGLTAIEYVSGQFNPATQILTMKGYGKNDPNAVLVMTDNYRLTLSGNNRSLNGAAQNGGKWDGRLILSRQ